MALSLLLPDALAGFGVGALGTLAVGTLLWRSARASARSLGEAEIARVRAEASGEGAVRAARLEEREAALAARGAEVASRETEVESRILEVASREKERDAELARVAGLTPEAARAEILAGAEAETAPLAAARAKTLVEDAEANAARLARAAILTVVERTAVDAITEATVAVVPLPSEDMKGRLIGREGRNIRAFETITGTDLLIDETPEAVTISSFDPVRRETARLALQNLMLDGRIHPAKIEEHHAKATAEIERVVIESGERAAERADVLGLPPHVLATLGRLRFRTGYGQNVLDHSVETARLAAGLAHELGFDVALSRRAGLLHDIGKALGPEWDGPHALTGRDYLAGQGLTGDVLNAVGAHHRDIEPETPEAHITIVADAISAGRPGARRESLEGHVKRLGALEALAKGFPGVESAFAVQAGRELRIAVRADKVDDLKAARLANEVARRIEAELAFPAPVRVTVLRETRAVATAKPTRS